MSVVQNASTPKTLSPYTTQSPTTQSPITQSPITQSSITGGNASTPLKKTPLGDNSKKDDAPKGDDSKKDDVPKDELASFVASPAGISPPDDVVGDVMPFSLFPLADGNHFEQEVNNIAHVVKTLPKYDVKIQTINKIPTGMVKIEKL